MGKEQLSPPATAVRTRPSSFPRPPGATQGPAASETGSRQYVRLRAFPSDRWLQRDTKYQLVKNTTC